MPWRIADTVSLRFEFITLSQQEGANVRDLCRRFEISPKTGYKWINRFLEEGMDGLEDRSRRPHTMPRKTPEKAEKAVLAVREKNREWGGRKIYADLRRKGWKRPPRPSTITGILRRHGKLGDDDPGDSGPYQRFEAESPNDLWQMDFKGHFPLEKGQCHPLSVLDDHSRFALGLQACGDEQEKTVRERLSLVFERYGLPRRILVDNGPSWSARARGGYTHVEMWWMRLGIRISHSSVRHPQTVGKTERFHRTLKAELLQWEQFRDLGEAQVRFDAWRDKYNLERPHEALEMDVPADRYQVSQRPFPSVLPPIEYGPDDEVRKVQDKGIIFFRNRTFKVGKAFKGHPVAVRPTTSDGCFEVFFCNQTVAQIDLKEENPDA